MRWLLWKEYRQNRVVVIALLVMLVLPHMFGAYAMWWEWREPNVVSVSRIPFAEECRECLAGASFYSLMISQLALALIGGNAIAGERADRSAEFQVYLPLMRKKILAAKLLLALAIAAVIWLTNPLVIWGALASMHHPMIDASEALTYMTYTAITGLVFFCVAWFFSTILRSPTVSVVAGLVAPVLVWSLIVFGFYLFIRVQGDDWRPKIGVNLFVLICYLSVSLSVALPAFGVGTWLYLRRVEP